jgi:hypothetical protein
MTNAIGVTTRKNRSAMTVGLIALATMPPSLDPAALIAINVLPKPRRTIDRSQRHHAGFRDRLRATEIVRFLTSRWSA